MIAAFALASSILLCGCPKRDTQKKVSEVSGVKVETGRPVEAVFQDKLRVYGAIEADVYADLCARIDGTIDNLAVDDGYKVAEGDTLFQSDRINLEGDLAISDQNKKVAEAKLKRAKIELELKKVEREKAFSDFERAKRLSSGKVISDDLYEQSELKLKKGDSDILACEAELELAEAYLGQAKTSYEIAKKDLDDSIIHSPISGLVIKTYKKTGEFAKRGETVLRIENADKLIIKILPSSNYYARVESGKTRAYVNDLDGRRIGEGLVSYKSPMVHTDSRTFEIEIALQGDKNLVLGMLCDVELLLGERKGLGVPREAVLARSGGKSVIFAANGKNAQEIEVKPGLRSDKLIELLDFSTPEMAVIVKGQSFLNDGTPIIVGSSPDRN